MMIITTKHRWHPFRSEDVFVHVCLFCSCSLIDVGHFIFSVMQCLEDSYDFLRIPLMSEGFHGFLGAPFDFLWCHSIS